ncbi:FUSC family protein [Reyranella sp.]|uniref:FUSC family protein n=1 Tax=Reyranella sp. TaxID=1929291 RepID=UPI003BAD790B
MIRRLLRAISEDFAELADLVWTSLEGYGRELLELGSDPVRTRQGIVAACSVVLATFLALLLEIESPWWAAISGFMSLMATGAGSLRRGLLRLTGTAAGALLGFVMARWLPYDHVALTLFLALVTMLGVIAMQVSPHGLAFLFLTITSSMVLLMSLNNPEQAAAVAYYRVLEVAVGVGSAIVVAKLLQDWHAEPPPQAPGWRHLLGAQWPVVLHGVRSAIAVVAVLWIWIMIDLPEVAEMAITVAVVMSAPVIADGGLGTRHAVAVRSIHRFLGCLIGGVVALAFLAMQIESFAWWLALIGAAAWIGMHIQSGPHGVGYVGTQSGFVFIITMVQGAAPPDSIMPGVDRFIGITGGLGILLVISLLLWPSDKELAEEKASSLE